MEIPKNIVAGDSIEWVDLLASYLSPEWSLKYSLVCPLGKIEFISAPDADSGGHLFSISSAITALWQPGKYAYQVYATSGTDRKTVGRGFLTIEIDLSTQDVYDARPLLDREIEAVENAKFGRASSSQLAMEIDGSRIEHISHLDHDELLGRLYKRRAARERARTMALGKSPFGTGRVEF